MSGYMVLTAVGEVAVDFIRDYDEVMGTVAARALSLSHVDGRATVVARSVATERPRSSAPGTPLVDRLRVPDDARGLLDALVGDVRIVGNASEAVAAHGSWWQAPIAPAHPSHRRSRGLASTPVPSPDDLLDEGTGEKTDFGTYPKPIYLRVPS